MDMKTKVLKWFATGETGMSSEAMASAVCGIESQKWHPCDPADFNRCLKLIRDVPEIKEHMGKVSALSPVWEKLVARWDEVEKCFLDEVGLDWSKGRRLHATKTYALMKEIGC